MEKVVGNHIEAARPIDDPLPNTNVNHIAVNDGTKLSISRCIDSECIPMQKGGCIGYVAGSVHCLYGYYIVTH